MPTCVFCQIIAGEIPATHLAETASCLAISDIHPKAPVHILVLPKRHCERPAELTSQEREDLLALEEQLAAEKQVAETGYRLVINVGPDAGQEIAHLHLHLLGGRSAKSMF